MYWYFWNPNNNQQQTMRMPYRSGKGRSIVQYFAWWTTDLGFSAIKNRELRQLFNEPDLVAFIKQRQTEVAWSRQKSVRGVVNNKGCCIASREAARGRPRILWLDDAEEDLYVLRERRWQTKAKGRVEDTVEGIPDPRRAIDISNKYIVLLPVSWRPFSQRE